ncbi:MAG: hypothetical protein ABGY95_10245 [Rubritalea sp.]|uniref:hypothetical protein n=1 Tax=Rubritalea sp. TaxID=2109375 RepID=UPI003242B332
MKTLTTLCSLFLSCALMAENNGQQANQGFLNTAREYDAKAERASNKGYPENAKIFKRLAEIKREAAISTNGYDWSEYHKLRGQLNSNNKRHKGKKAGAAKKENKGKSFNEAAVRYDKLAEAAQHAGNTEKSATYSRLAEIKREAQKSGGNFDWSEYKKLKAALHKGKKNSTIEPSAAKDIQKKEATSKKELTAKSETEAPPTNFITAAQKHATLANKSNAEEDNYSAQIHTRLAAILIDAAAKQSENRPIDWAEYKELKELLGQ